MKTTVRLDPSNERRDRRRRLIAWTTAGAAVVLALLVDGVEWSPGLVLILGIFLIFPVVIHDWSASHQGANAYRYGVGLALAAAILLFWVNGAVGIIGSEDNDANLIFFAVHATALVGVGIARFKPRAMARAMRATAAAQIVAFLTAWLLGWGFTGPITLFFTGLWLGSAALFDRAWTRPETEPATARAEQDGASPE